MGGDYAPGEIVRGAVEGARLCGVDVVLVGDQQAISSHLGSREPEGFVGVSIRHASQVVGMHESVDAVRTKRDASVVVAASMVKNGEADAMVSVGNTAAAMAVATLKLGRIPGIDRPAIATVIPSRGGATVLLDAGAVVDCSVQNLEQFAVMGSVYAQNALGIADPRVGLLSVGEEKSKGSDLIRAAHARLAQSALNFVGNVEGRDLFSGAADVVVADGFAGNVALKTAEGLSEFIEHLLKEEFRAHPLIRIPLLFLLPSVNRMKKRLDYSDYGGAPLLGLNGVCIIGHGRSKARAVASAVRAAKEAVGGGVVSAIRDHVESADAARDNQVGSDVCSPLGCEVTSQDG